MTAWHHGEHRYLTAEEDAAWRAQVDATAAAIRAEREAAAEQPAEPPAPVDVRALAAGIRNGTADRNTRPDLRDMAREILR